MKKIFTPFAFIACISFAAQAQTNVPQLLKEPANWQFERFALPPEFAADFPFKGAEELRFSPGMFKKDSADYFTYAFVAELENTPSVSQDDVKNYLTRYFKGLCQSTADNRKLAIDTSKITVAVQRKKELPANQIIYNASLQLFGVFTDGAPVALNMEVKELTNAAAKKTYLFFIASPQPKTNTVWEKLYQLQKQFTVPR